MVVSVSSPTSSARRAAATAICPSAMPPSFGGTARCSSTAVPGLLAARAASRSVSSRFWKQPPVSATRSSPTSRRHRHRRGHQRVVEARRDALARTRRGPGPASTARQQRPPVQLEGRAAQPPGARRRDLRVDRIGAPLCRVGQRTRAPSPPGPRRSRPRCRPEQRGDGVEEPARRWWCSGAVAARAPASGRARARSAGANGATAGRSRGSSAAAPSQLPEQAPARRGAARARPRRRPAGGTAAGARRARSRRRRPAGTRRPRWCRRRRSRCRPR